MLATTSATDSVQESLNEIFGTGSGSRLAHSRLESVRSQEPHVRSGSAPPSFEESMSTSSLFSTQPMLRSSEDPKPVRSSLGERTMSSPLQLDGMRGRRESLDWGLIGEGTARVRPSPLGTSLSMSTTLGRPQSLVDLLREDMGSDALQSDFGQRRSVFSSTLEGSSLRSRSVTNMATLLHEHEHSTLGGNPLNKTTPGNAYGFSGSNQFGGLGNGADLPGSNGGILSSSKVASDFAGSGRNSPMIDQGATGLGGGLQSGAPAASGMSAAMGASSNAGNRGEVDQLSASLLGMAMSPRAQTAPSSAPQAHAQHTQAQQQGHVASMAYTNAYQMQQQQQQQQAQQQQQHPQQLPRHMLQQQHHQHLQQQHLHMQHMQHQQMMQHPHMQQHPQHPHQMQHLAGHPHAMHMQAHHMQGAVLNPATGELTNAQFAHAGFANPQMIPQQMIPGMIPGSPGMYPQHMGYYPQHMQQQAPGAPGMYPPGYPGMPGMANPMGLPPGMMAPGGAGAYPYLGMGQQPGQGGMYGGGEAGAPHVGMPHPMPFNVQDPLAMQLYYQRLAEMQAVAMGGGDPSAAMAAMLGP
eukprot:CAMPEP_0118958648 /NCGR_PEP_ID=MMETSP1169-20130426/62731_1 /TAXON_ID=36882 /ORGANISM="Pyramimonas obovata, Strain CCMP722" /LENGTH=578 /DNA_ID=CAMNT_0006906773 /DNA_START=1265 /DNA_END=2998 /DNA_ORIENTATION=-